MDTNLGSPLNTLNKQNASPQEPRHSPKDSLIKQDVDHECTKRLPAARRFVTLRASANNVMRKLEVHSLLARRFVTLRASGNNVMRKLEAHGLLATVMIQCIT